MSNKSKDLGVVIGRFQIHEPHAGHLALLDEVESQHEEMLILLATTNVRFNPVDPYPFEIRQQMLKSYYRKAIILPIADSLISPDHWSRDVDQVVSGVSKNGRAILYGSRDCFIPKYTGRYQTCYLENKSDLSATAIRANVGKTFINDPEFRLGWLAALNCQFPITDPTVDAAIVRNNFTEVLVGRRSKDAPHYRFVGGFIDKSDVSAEVAVLRESGEEVSGLQVGDPEYIGSRRVNDKRYKNSGYGIMTFFFALAYLGGEVSGADDMPHVEWRPLNQSLATGITPEHEPLANMLIAYAAKKRELVAA